MASSLEGKVCFSGGSAFHLQLKPIGLEAKKLDRVTCLAKCIPSLKDHFIVVKGMYPLPREKKKNISEISLPFHGGLSMMANSFLRVNYVFIRGLRYQLGMPLSVFSSSIPLETPWLPGVFIHFSVTAANPWDKLQTLEPPFCGQRFFQICEISVAASVHCIDI